ncbi:hypothetical protein ACWEIK_22405 [Streptomyces sp. NPDC004673]
MNALVQRSLDRLAALDGSPYTAVPGSAQALDALASVVHAASVASTHLAEAVSHNPLRGASFAGYPSDAHARHQEAVPAVGRCLGEAMHELDLASTGCSYIAHGIERDLKEHAEHSCAKTPTVTAQATPAAAPETQRSTGPTR